MTHEDKVEKFEMLELVPKGAKDREEEDQAHDCSELQRQAFELGRKKGNQEGRAQCQAKVDEELKRAIQLANHIGRARVVALEEQERDIVEVALAISRQILLREVEVDKELVVRQVRQALGLLFNTNLVTLKVHPQDFEILEPLHQTLREECMDGDQLVIEADEGVERGGCLVEQTGLQLDARLTQQLVAIAMEFGLEPQPS